MYIKRHMGKPVMALNLQYPLLLITGLRQAGKTTMLKHLIDEEGRGRAMVSMDDLMDREIAKTDPKMFFQIRHPPLLIDEVQYAPELFPYIMIMADTRRQPGDFWSAGSQLFKMTEGVQKSLAGRVALLRLLPLSQGEMMGCSENSPFSLELSALAARQKHCTLLDTPSVFKYIYQGGIPTAGQRCLDQHFLLQLYRHLSGTGCAPDVQ